MKYSVSINLFPKYSLSPKTPHGSHYSPAESTDPPSYNVLKDCLKRSNGKLFAFLVDEAKCKRKLVKLNKTLHDFHGYAIIHRIWAFQMAHALHFLLTDTSVRRIPPFKYTLCWSLLSFQSFCCNQNPYKTDTSLRRTTDTLKSSTNIWKVVLVVHNTSKREYRCWIWQQKNFPFFWNSKLLVVINKIVDFKQT